VPCRNAKRFRGGLVFKAHRLLYHSTLGLRVIRTCLGAAIAVQLSHAVLDLVFRADEGHLWFGVWGLGFRVLGLGV